VSNISLQLRHSCHQLSKHSVRSQLAMTSLSCWMTSHVGCDDVNWLRVTKHRLSCSSTLIILQNRNCMRTSCAGGRHNMPPFPASWPLTFWPWKWCPSHVRRGLSVCQF